MDTGGGTGVGEGVREGEREGRPSQVGNRGRPQLPALRPTT